VFALGSIEMPSEYIELGKIYVTPSNKKFAIASILSLPYLKPEGITKVDTKDARCIIIYSLIADEKKIKAKSLFPQEKNIVSLKFEETDISEEVRYIDMVLRGESETVNNQRKLLNLSYQSETGKSRYKEQYTIPFGTREVFLTYCVQIPIYTEDYYFIDFLNSEIQTVRWEIEWISGFSTD
jgi:hypothetical protein